MPSIAMADDDKPYQRRIIICCDGTWQSSVSGADNMPSNVTRLCRVIKRMGEDKKTGQKFHQLVYYDSGVGTGNLSESEKKRQGGFGAGLAENVIEAYNFIVLNYEEGDEIFCFGFSRGAYTARAVAGLVTDIGVIRPVDMQIFPAIYRAYKKNTDGKEFRLSEAWLEFVRTNKAEHEEHSKKISAAGVKRSESPELGNRKDGDLALPKSRTVKVIGVWDTVGSLGVPDVGGIDNSNYRVRHGFHNVKLNEGIQHAFHALALDERRKAFRPTLWFVPHELKDKAKESREAHDKNPEVDLITLPELKQVWFPGVHINCGGGSDDAIMEMKGDLEQLSTITFCWMLQCIAPFITIDQKAFLASLEQYQHWLDRVRYACTYHHPQREGWAEWAWNKIPNIPFVGSQPDELAGPRRDPEHKHDDFDYGYGTGPIVDSYGGMYAANGEYKRVPGHCQAEIWDDKLQEHALGDINVLGDTHEYIHPVCRYRDLIRGFEDNAALKNFERKFEAKDASTAKGKYVWNKKGDAKKLDEWIIKRDDDNEINYERRWYAACERGTKELVALRKDRDFRNSGSKDWLRYLDSKIDFDFAV